MADEEITLSPILKRTQVPIKSVVRLSKPATTNYTIKAGHNINVPNVWELLKSSVQLVTTADVANRVIRMYLQHKEDDVGGAAQGEYYTSDNIAASSNKSIGLYRHADLSGLTQNDDFTGVIYPGSWIFCGDDEINIFFDADVAGDVASILLMFRWLNWELGMDPPVIPGLDDKPVQKKSTCKWF